jgi:hypothetical protein
VAAMAEPDWEGLGVARGAALRCQCNTNCILLAHANRPAELRRLCRGARVLRAVQAPASGQPLPAELVELAASFAWGKPKLGERRSRSPRLLHDWSASLVAAGLLLQHPEEGDRGGRSRRATAAGALSRCSRSCTSRGRRRQGCWPGSWRSCR